MIANMMLGLSLWIRHGSSLRHREELHVFLGCFACAIAMTNQIHAWCHQPASSLNPVVRGLQKLGLILNHEEHMKHHAKPYDKSYCITTGWLNRFLDQIAFWRGLERIIQQTTGMMPREDDQKWTE